MISDPDRVLSPCPHEQSSEDCTIRENGCWELWCRDTALYCRSSLFNKGRQSVNSDTRSGRPSASRNEDNIAQMKVVVRSDHRLTIREIAQECHISIGSCDEILRKDLNMHRVSAKFVPHLLTENLQFQRLATSSHLFQSARDNPEFMKLIITWDES
ncbi:HTH_48 domain-containing protein [Trichonephila clavipes]|nr:HTH_48 domain-containing protein [Trichonephila clavipes]